MEIRAESATDGQAITEIIEQAFGRSDEGRLVRNLRELPGFDPALSLIAVDNGKPVGHLLLTPVQIIEDDAAHNSLALAPVSVIPARQGESIGSRLIRESMLAAKGTGHTSIIVLGHAEYYPRFGFRRASDWNIRPPFDVPDEAFMALELVSGALSNVSGVVHYPAPFLQV